MKKRVMNLALAIIQFILIFFLISYLLQDMSVFPGAVSSFFSDIDSNRGKPEFAEAMTLATEDGKKLEAWYLPAKEAKQVVIIFHGNAAFLHSYIDTYEKFLSKNISVFSINYRGYGKSTGWPSESGIYKDAEAAMGHVRSVLNYSPEKVIVFGQSLGTAPASFLASKYEISTLILISPLLSISDVVYDVTIYWPVWFLVWTKFPVKHFLEQTKAQQVIIAHGTKDEIIPFKHSETLFEIIPAEVKKDFVKVKQAHHNSTLSPGMLEKAILPRLSSSRKVLVKSRS